VLSEVVVDEDETVEAAAEGGGRSRGSTGNSTGRSLDEEEEGEAPSNCR